MGDGISLARVAPAPIVVRRPESLLYAPAWFIAIGTLFAGGVAASQVGLTWKHIVIVYGVPAVAMTLLVLMAAMFFTLIGYARELRDNPFQALKQRWLTREMLPRLALPALAAPLFMTGFTTLKAAATLTRAYDWDVLLTDIDAMLFFGTDPWILTHRLLNVWIVPDLLEKFYVGWQVLLPASVAGVAIWMKPRDVGLFFCAMLSTWVVGGVLAAYWMHSAGPIFAYIFDDDLGARFAALSESLRSAMPSGSRILRVHSALALGILDSDVNRGGGISAMPSMHVAATAIYVFAAWKYRYWRAAAIAFAVIIWIGSVYFGYHYVTDGPVAFAIAALCWVGSKRLIGKIEGLLSRAPDSRAEPLEDLQRAA